MEKIDKEVYESMLKRLDEVERELSGKPGLDEYIKYRKQVLNSLFQETQTVSE